MRTCNARHLCSSCDKPTWSAENSGLTCRTANGWRNVLHMHRNAIPLEYMTYCKSGIHQIPRTCKISQGSTLHSVVIVVPVHAMKAHMGEGEEVTRRTDALILYSTLHGDQRSTADTGHFAPLNELRYTMNRQFGRPQRTSKFLP
jgi:hypothetical protein